MPFKKTAVMVSLMLMLGCAEYAVLKSTVSEEGARIADEALQAVIWKMCNAMPVGAIVRRFNTPELREAFHTICKDVAPIAGG